MRWRQSACKLRVGLVLSLFVLCSASLPLLRDGGEDVEAAFTDFMDRYGKTYSNDDKAFRLQVFRDNHAWVVAHNQQPNATWTAAINEFADLTWEEAKARLGARQPCKASLHPTTLRSQLPEPPETKDWRSEGVVTPVKKQGVCGACWAFSATGCMEGVWAIKTGQLVALSEQQLIDCSVGNKGCLGGLASSAMEYVVEAGGLEAETVYPFAGKTQKSCGYNKTQAVANFSGVVNITQNDEEDLLSVVGTTSPVSITLHFELGFQFYSGGVYTSSSCPTTPEKADHATLAVGYDHDATTGLDYWIVKNSWGTGWGIDGYFWMQRGVNMCGLATCANYVLP